MEKLYRIWDVEKQKYFSTGKKSIWKSETYANQALQDLLKSTLRTWINQNPDNYEIHTIEQIVKEKEGGRAVIDKLKRKEALDNKNLEEYYQVKEDIKKIVPELSINQISDMYKRRLFTEEINENLKPLIEKEILLKKILN